MSNQPKSTLFKHYACSWWGTPVKLHALWDHLIRPTPGGNSLTLSKSILTQITPAQIAEWTQGGPSEWVLDTYGVAKRTAYEGLPAGPTPPGVSIKLPRRYFSIMQPTVKTQLAKAGFRLATLLNTIFDPVAKTP